MPLSLSARQKAYEYAYDNKIINRVPVIIRLDGKGFSRLTSKIQKPYCPKMQVLMSSTMLDLAKEIEGCIFAYQQSDEITCILRNDQSLDSQSWFGNRIQKITSISASLATYHFNKLYNEAIDRPELIGQAVFDARVFAVPSINEAVNNLIFRQQDCIRNAISCASQVELGRLVGKKTAIKILHQKTGSERLEILKTKCNIDFYNSYSTSFRNGIAAYKVPKIFHTEQGKVTRQKWALDINLPAFVSNREFVLNILNYGNDIFRAERDLGYENTTEQEG
jgi:tRNA(His) 5'-end guanylyltransferase